jgi:hypothetical protein
MIFTSVWVELRTPNLRRSESKYASRGANAHRQHDAAHFQIGNAAVEHGGVQLVSVFARHAARAFFAAADFLDEGRGVKWCTGIFHVRRVLQRVLQRYYKRDDCSLL